MSTVATIEFDELIAADLEIISEQLEVKTGLNLLKGTVVAILTATGKIEGYTAAGAGGQEILFGILLEDVDTTSVIKSAAILKHGAVNEDKLIFIGTGDKDTTNREARLLGIYYKIVSQ